MCVGGMILTLGLRICLTIQLSENFSDQNVSLPGFPWRKIIFRLSFIGPQSTKGPISLFEDINEGRNLYLNECEETYQTHTHTHSSGFRPRSESACFSLFLPILS